MNEGFKEIKNIIPSVIDEIEKVSKRKIIQTGYDQIDQVITGLNKGELIVVGSRPCVGKTDFAINIMRNIARIQEKAIAYVSLEMSAEILVQRMISMEGNIDRNNLIKGQLSDEEWNSFFISMGNLSNSKIFIDDSPGIYISEIENRLCKLVQENRNLGLVIIDYLQLIRGTSDDFQFPDVSEMLKRLKKLALHLNLPIIVLSQLNRDIEKREDKCPKAGDIRGLASFEDVTKSVDKTLFLYREDDELEVIIPNNRTRLSNIIELSYVEKYGIIRSL